MRWRSDRIREWATQFNYSSSLWWGTDANVIELRIPAEKHLAPQGPRILERIPDAELVTIEHEGNGRAYEAKAAEIAAAILRDLGSIR